MSCSACFHDASSAEKPKAQSPFSVGAMADMTWQTVGYAAWSEKDFEEMHNGHTEGILTLSSSPMSAVTQELQRLAGQFGGNMTGQRTNKKKLKQGETLLMKTLLGTSFRLFRVCTTENIPTCLLHGRLELGQLKGTYLLPKAVNPFKPNLPATWKIESQQPGCAGHLLHQLHHLCRKRKLASSGSCVYTRSKHKRSAQ